MAFTAEQFQAIITGTEEERVESLRQLLNYPLSQRDREGSRFWYLRPGQDKDDAEETCPIAVSFYPELDIFSDSEAKQWLTSEPPALEIRGHYLGRVADSQPVMYLLLPLTDKGRVAFILPTESKLRQRSIQTFTYKLEDLKARLERLHWSSLADKVQIRITGLIPQVDWIFYKPAVSAKELAHLLAGVTRRIEQAIPTIYNTEETEGYLHKLLKSFQKELLPTLKLSSDNENAYSFADIYAQTIAYGLFTARVFSHVKNPRLDFNRQQAWQHLPETNPFLKQLFQDISTRPASELGDELIDAISEALEILRAAKMDAILTDFRNKMNREDIVIRFYEDFLTAYKPTMRERRGVYYTPEPVVSYMVRSVDLLLQEKFNKPLGIADPEVMLLDPACGTGTFLLYIFQLIYKRFQENPTALTEGIEDKTWSGYVKHRLLPRVFGFELLMAPYAICHLKLGLFLEETGYQFDSGKRLGVYLINTLEDINVGEEEQQLTIPVMESLIAAEAQEGSLIKKQEPIMVVIGNPPYSYDSSNNGEWISGLVRDYYQVNGKDLGERNPKGLQDDYVKFIRFAQWRIDKSGKGILAFISNHGFLDNPTFRGMRQHFINSFDGISVYDLHGNSKKKEKQSDGSADENVFDIQQGVSITLAIKSLPVSGSPLNKGGRGGSIEHSHLFGSRDYKYQILTNNTIKTTNFTLLTPQSEFFLLVPQDRQLLPEYEKGWKITDIMPVNSTGVKTHRDHFVLDFDLLELRKKIENFRDLTISDEDIKNLYDLQDTRDWKLSIKRKSLAANQKWQDYFTSCLYRPFDIRYYYHHEDVVELPRYKVMQHLLKGKNIGLICSRQQSQSGKWGLVGVSNVVIESCAISNKTKEINSLFPLYLYPNPNKPKEIQQEKRPNFSPDFLKEITERLGYLPIPEAIFYYIYAVFHSPTYRSRYAEFLKIDFPRVPLTNDKDLFNTLSEHGEKLVGLHLMTSPLLDNLTTQFIKQGDCVVAAGYPKYIQGSVQINKQGDAFTEVPESVYSFYIGGYQVCHKWLKDRKGRTLSAEDILHYQKIIIALAETIKLMQSIEEAIPGWPIT